MRALARPLLAGCALAFPLDAGAQQATLAIEGSAFRPVSVPGVTGLTPLETRLRLDASFRHEWSRGRYVFRAAPFARWDPSGHRSRLDFKDLNVAVLGRHWELKVGLAEVAWGVVESRRLVDGINQRDLVGGGQDYLRLGQLMADLTAIRSWGTVDVFLLPWFRERIFDGHGGLLWSPHPVDVSRTAYEAGAGRWRLDWAVRWRHTLGPLDVAVSHLQGNLREPSFVEVEAAQEGTVLAPRYSVGGLTGLEAQLAAGRLIWKLEALTADPDRRRYVAVTGGVEYGIGDYLALFLEYDWDSRGDAATTSFGDDFFVGGRLFLPGGQLRGGAYLDRRSLNMVASVGMDWRLGDATTLGAEVGAFLGDSSEEPPLGRRQQTGLSLRLSRYF